MTVPWPVQVQARRHLLALRETLVRVDENAKAYDLLDRCVPHFLEDDPDVANAHDDQTMMTAHIRDPKAYAAYYGSNRHERPFEEQYQVAPGAPVTAEGAHLAFSRVAFLRDRLALDGRVLDCACNDGWLAENLRHTGLVSWYDGIDLNPDCIARAKDREVRNSAFHVGHAETAPAWEGGPKEGSYDAVVAFEVVEHVPDPDVLVRAMRGQCKPDGSLFISTPNGVDHGGDLPDWWVVEPKGHVRVYTPRSFAALLERHGEIVTIELGPDGTLNAEVKP